MELTITSDFAKHLFTRSKKDAKLARVLARQFLNSVEPHAMARFLLQPEVAEKLLTSRVMQNPEQTRGGSGAGPFIDLPGDGNRHHLTTEDVHEIPGQESSIRWISQRRVGIVGRVGLKPIRGAITSHS